MTDRRQRVAEGGPEAGFLLLAVVVMAAIVLIALSVAAPIVAYKLRRDKEVESEHRAEQYVRAIQLYYRKNQGYPASIKALENTNNVRYLRKQYVDPLTGKSDWRLIHQGEQKTTIKGFFGQELTGLGGAGGGLGAASGMQSGIGGGAAIGGSSTISAGGLGAGFNGATVGPNGAPGDAGASGANGTSGANGAPGTGGSSGTNGSGTGSSSSTGMFGDSGGGGPIVGVGTSKTGNSILTPNQQSTYETWEFWYDPRIELMKRNVNIMGGGMSSQPASSGMGSGIPGAPGTSNPTGGSSNSSGPGSGSGSSGFGNSGGSGGSSGFGNSGGGSGSSGFGNSGGSGGSGSTGSIF